MTRSLLGADAARRAEQVGLRAFATMYGRRAVDVGGALALHAPEAPDSPMLNRVVGLGLERPAAEEELDAAIAAMTGVRFYVTVSPDARPPRLADWLRERGFEPGGGWMQFRRGLDDPAAAESELELVEIAADDGPAFARIVPAAYGMPPAAEPWVARAPTFPGRTCWLALADGEPAGAAGLFVAEGAGYLGLAGTLPEHRGKGAQGALLAARVRRAREHGCDAIFTETGELLAGRPSASYRSILRAGFEELYVVPNWLSPARVTSTVPGQSRDSRGTGSRAVTPRGGRPGRRTTVATP